MTQNSAPAVSELANAIVDEPSGVREKLEHRVADIVVDTLIARGVTTFFGIPGGAISPIYDALVARPEAKVVNVRHETSAVYMAMGHCRATGGLSCVLVTSGPGITNALTGIASASLDGIPVLILAGEVPRGNFGRGALQEGSRYELDVVGMVRSITRYADEARNARGIVALLHAAIDAALGERRGPAFLSLPLDVTCTRAEATTLVRSSAPKRVELDSALLRDTARILESAKRGLLLVGSGARHDGASRLVRELSERLQLPVATTPKAKGLFPESHPLSLGVYGHGGHPCATQYLSQGVDVLLAIGCGLGEPGTNSWNELLIPTGKFIQIDVDARQFGKNYHVDIGIQAPSHIALARMLEFVSAKRTARVSAAVADSERCESWGDTQEDSSPLKPARAIHLLQQQFPANTIFTSDIGEHLLFALHYLRIEEPDAFIVHQGLGSMGSGVVSAIGAKMALPHRCVVAICGDYGFSMHGMDIATCVEHGVGVTFAILNDARMRMVESGMSRTFGRNPTLHGPRIDFAAVARATGAIGYTIRTREDLQQVPVGELRGNRPVVLDFEIDPTAAFRTHSRVAEIKTFTAK